MTGHLKIWREELAERLTRFNLLSVQTTIQYSSFRVLEYYDFSHVRAITRVDCIYKCYSIFFSFSFVRCGMTCEIQSTNLLSQQILRAPLSLRRLLVGPQKQPHFLGKRGKQQFWKLSFFTLFILYYYIPYIILIFLKCNPYYIEYLEK